MSERTVVHLVPHTHWDREWYEPFQTFRMRLVELVDQLLELRLVAEHDEPTEAIVRGDFREARAVDLLGREGERLPCAESLLRVPLRAWEIATVRLR